MLTDRSVSGSDCYYNYILYVHEDPKYIRCFLLKGGKIVNLKNWRMFSLFSFCQELSINIIDFQLCIVCRLTKKRVTRDIPWGLQILKEDHYIYCKLIINWWVLIDNLYRNGYAFFSVFFISNFSVCCLTCYLPKCHK